MDNSSLISLINDQSASPSYPCVLVRGCTVIADAPASSIIFEISSAFTCFLSQPLLILTVTGISTVSTTVLTISYTLDGFFNSALPAFPSTATLLTGHPIFMSMMSGFIFSETYCDAVLNDSTVEPNICCDNGRSYSVMYNISMVFLFE